MGVTEPADSLLSLIRGLRSTTPEKRVAALVDLVCSNPPVAYLVLPDAIGSPSELMAFVQQVRVLRGMGSGLKGAIEGVLRKAPLDWYLTPLPGSRDGGVGMTWADIMRLVHPTPRGRSEQALFRFLSGHQTLSDFVSELTNARPSGGRAGETLEDVLHRDGSREGRVRGR